MPNLIVWFRRHPPLTLSLTAAYFVAVVLLHDQVQAIFLWLLERLGRGPYQLVLLLIAIAGLAVASGRVLSRRGSRQPHRLLTFYWITTLAGIAVSYVFLVALSSEAIHFPQYALLAIPLFALTGRVVDTLLWVVLLGAVDEGYQYWVLKRDWGIYYDFNDVLLNIFGGALGVLLVLAAPAAARAVNNNRSPRSLLRSAAVITSVALVLAGMVLYAVGRLHLAPQSDGPEPWILLSRGAIGNAFWTKVEWGKDFHILRPMAAVAWIAALTAFYGRLDAVPRLDGGSGAHGNGTAERTDNPA